jgi:hypothetical protein
MFLSEKASWQEALKLVPPCWRIEFARFLEEGEASDKFLAFLGQDADCRQACELVLRADEQMRLLVSETKITANWL